MHGCAAAHHLLLGIATAAPAPHRFLNRCPLPYQRAPNAHRKFQTLALTDVLALQVFSLLSAILWLGNIKFVASTGDGVAVVRDPALATAAELLGVSEDALTTALTTRNLTISEFRCRSERHTLALQPSSGKSPCPPLQLHNGMAAFLEGIPGVCM